MELLLRPVRSLLGLLLKMHRKIPLRIRQRYVPAFYEAYSRIKDRGLDVYFPPVTVLHGTAPDSGRPLAFAYAGTEENALEYWGRMALAPGSGRKPLGRCLFWRIPRRIQKAWPECDFLLTEHTAPMLSSLSRKPGFRIPFWVNMEVPLPNLHRKEWKRQRKDLARRIRKNGLDYEISKDPEVFQDFLWNMHMPFITQRFEETALLPDVRYLERVFSRGGLILIKKGKDANNEKDTEEGPDTKKGTDATNETDATNGTDTVGAGLFEYLPGMIWMRKVGVRDGDWEYVRQGVIGAVYYFLMTEMEEQGQEKISFGGTRPFLRDGVTSFKSSLNGRLALDSEAPGAVALWLTLRRDSPALRDFLAENPFIYFPEPNEPRRAIFVRGESDDWREALPETLHATECPGLKGTTVFVLGQTDGGSLTDVASEASPSQPELEVRPAEELFR